MFSVIVESEKYAWESEQRMSIDASRFREHSGDEVEGMDINDPKSLKALEHTQALLMYENHRENEHNQSVKVGEIYSIKVRPGRVSFRFTESGRLSRDTLYDLMHRVQMTKWEFSRTHWAIKDGEIPQDILNLCEQTPETYDIVLSFAGEDRGYVEQVAEYLDKNNVKVFYDAYEEHTLWGKHLTEHLHKVYRDLGRFCVMFVSAEYAEKMWPRHERRAVLERILKETREYVLPARFDDTEIPGINEDIGHISLKDRSPEDLGKLIMKKLGRA